LESTGKVVAMVIARIEKKPEEGGAGEGRGKFRSSQCGPVGRHMLTALQGNDSQNETQHQKGVTRSQLILAVVSAEILRMRSTLPLLGCMMSTFMLVKRLSLWWWDIFVSIYFLLPKSWK
jgi:hypothetical protein